MVACDSQDATTCLSWRYTKLTSPPPPTPTLDLTVLSAALVRSRLVNQSAVIGVKDMLPWTQTIYVAEDYLDQSRQRALVAERWEPLRGLDPADPSFHQVLAIAEADFTG